MNRSDAFDQTSPEKILIWAVIHRRMRRETNSLQTVTLIDWGADRHFTIIAH